MHNRVRVERSRHETIKNHIHRYFSAVHGKGYVYRSPASFQNRVERWMLSILKDDEMGMLQAEKEIKEIEAHFRVV